MTENSDLETYGLGTVKFPAGRTIFRKGDQPDIAYLIIKGSVGFFINDNAGQRKQTMTIGSGDMFGEIALIQNSTRNTDTVALTDCTCLVLEKEVLIKRLAKTDPFIRFWIEFMSDRLRDLEARLVQ